MRLPVLRFIIHALCAVRRQNNATRPFMTRMRPGGRRERLRAGLDPPRPLDLDHSVRPQHLAHPAVVSDVVTRALGLPSSRLVPGAQTMHSARLSPLHLTSATLALNHFSRSPACFTHPFPHTIESVCD